MSRSFDYSTMPDVTLEAVWRVLRWVLLVLAAGFIGQFGKLFATRLIERRRHSRTIAGIDELHSDAEISKARSEKLAKIEKKRAKNELKQAKKRRFP